MKILLVDDEPVILKSIGDFLVRLGHQVDMADSGRNALTFIKQTLPDVVLSDIRMEGLTGFDLLVTVRMHHIGLPVVLMTGHGDMHTAIEALKRGAFGYLCKPLKLEELVEILDRVSHRSNIERDAKATWTNLARSLPEGTDGEALQTICQSLENIQKQWVQLLGLMDTYQDKQFVSQLTLCVSEMDQLIGSAIHEAEVLKQCGLPSA